MKDEKELRMQFEYETEFTLEDAKAHHEIGIYKKEYEKWLEKRVINTVDILQDLYNAKMEGTSKGLEEAMRSAGYLLSGEKDDRKTMQEWSDFTGWYVAVDEDGGIYAYGDKPTITDDAYHKWHSKDFLGNAFQIPKSLVKPFYGYWRDSLHCPAEEEE